MAKFFLYSLKMEILAHFIRKIQKCFYIFTQKRNLQKKDLSSFKIEILSKREILEHFIEKPKKKLCFLKTEILARTIKIVFMFPEDRNSSTLYEKINFFFLYLPKNVLYLP